VQNSNTVHKIDPRSSLSFNTTHFLTHSDTFFHTLSNRPNKAMASSTLIERAQQAKQGHCPLLSLPAELRNMIYEYAFGVDHVQAIQYDNSVAGKATNNKYETPSSTYTMSFETRDVSNWRDVPQQLAFHLSLTTTCRQISNECKLMPFEGVLFDVSLPAIQHLLAVVPRAILDNIKVISLWKVRGQMMTSVGDMPFPQSRNENDNRVWITLLGLLRGLPALEKVYLRVRDGVDGLRFPTALAFEPLEIQLKAFVELVIKRVMGRMVVVHVV
jgi:hypothetical protein